MNNGTGKSKVNSNFEVKSDLTLKFEFNLNFMFKCSLLDVFPAFSEK